MRTVYAGFARHGIAQLDPQQEALVSMLQGAHAEHIHRLCLVSDAVLASGVSQRTSDTPSAI